MIIVKNPDSSVFGHFHELPKTAPKDIAHRYEKHIHTNKCEILYFLKGKASFTIEDVTRELKPGDMAFVPKGKYHCIHVDKGEEYERFVMEFSFGSIPFSSGLHIENLGGFYQAGEVSISSIIYEIEHKVGVFSDQDFQDYFYATIGKILYILSHKQKNQDTKKEDLLSSILAYLNDHVYSNIKSEDVASQFHMSLPSLNRYFKSQMDVSLHHYIKNMKMHKAYHMLSKGKTSEEVSKALGYNEYSTFYRSFVSIFDVSPNQFKK